MTSIRDFILVVVSFLILISSILGFVLDVLSAEVTILGLSFESSERLLGFSKEPQTKVSIIFAVMTIVGATSGIIFSILKLIDIEKMITKRWILLSYLFTLICSIIAWASFIAYVQGTEYIGSEMLDVYEKKADWDYQYGTFFLVATTILSLISLGLGWFIDQ